RASSWALDLGRIPVAGDRIGRCAHRMFLFGYKTCRYRETVQRFRGNDMRKNKELQRGGPI
ncbi:hypothetical protein ACC736_39775, partial [Rhizobium ruizarguesonis]